MTFFTSARSLAEEPAQLEPLYSKAVLLGPEPVKLLITRSDPRLLGDGEITATFTDTEGKKLAGFELANPVVPSAEVSSLTLGEGTPPTIKVSLTGGADGSSYHFMYFYSLVGGQITQTFASDWEDNYYFRQSHCGGTRQLDDGTVLLIEESPAKIKTSKIHWNNKLKRFERKNTQSVPIILIALDKIDLHDKPSLKASGVKKVDKGIKFEVLSVQECNAKKDGEACSIEPSEKARWFKVKDTSGVRYWIWEFQALDSNLVCNAPMNNSEE